MTVQGRGSRRRSAAKEAAAEYEEDHRENGAYLSDSFFQLICNLHYLGHVCIWLVQCKWPESEAKHHNQLLNNPNLQSYMKVTDSSILYGLISAEICGSES